MMMRGYLVDRIDEDLDRYSQPLADTAHAPILAAAGRDTVTRQPTFIPPSPYYVLVTPLDDAVGSFGLVYPQVRASPPDLQRVEPDDERLGEPFTVQARDQ